MTSIMNTAHKHYCIITNYYTNYIILTTRYVGPDWHYSAKN